MIAGHQYTVGGPARRHVDLASAIDAQSCEHKGAHVMETPGGPHVEAQDLPSADMLTLQPAIQRQE